MKHEPRPASSTENRLQIEVLNLQNALDEKTREADTLRSQLADVYAIIERYKTDSLAVVANGDEQFTVNSKPAENHAEENGRASGGAATPSSS